MRGMILTGALLASCMMLSEATIILPAVTIGGGALAGLALLKLAAIKGLALGALLSDGNRKSGRRGKRSLDDFESILLSASQHDTSDCAKRLVCELNGIALEEMGTQEAVLQGLFDPDNLDITKSTVEFDLAAQIGKRVGIRQCALIYERCPHNRQQLMDIIGNPDFGNEM
ncbi:uncharacterized protein [Lepeophtheirus salmonis]|uniref:uncharacterized protein n=1 Tax=Lepeophtheirus salmonis TaxID=72036 RepID=UPI001AEAC229|nr:uncharacterized protein LOC121124699 [Lepeophtheirus salmonis]